MSQAGMNELFSEFQKMRRELEEIKMKESRPDIAKSNEIKFEGQQNSSDWKLQQTLTDYKTKITSLNENIKSIQEQIENFKKEKLEQKEEPGAEVFERFTGYPTTGMETQPAFTTGTAQGRLNRPRPLSLEKRKFLLEKRPNTLKEIFMAEPIEEIAFTNWKRKRLVLIGEERLAERALSRIASHNIHSIPVVSSSVKGVIGTVDVLDIVQGLINAVDKSSTATIQQGIRRDFMNRPVSTLISKQSYVISSQSNLYSGLKKFLELNQDRFVIVDRPVEGDVAPLDHPENDVDGMFVLGDILKFLVSNSMLMRQNFMFQKTLRELGLGNQTPKTVHYKTFACDAFREIGRLCSMGLAVVNDNGQLVGNLSCSDLKGVTRNNCPILNSTVEDFLNRDQKRGWWERPFCLDLNDTLYHTVHQFVSTGIHRAYIVNSNGAPIGEVNHRDILNHLWKSFQ